MPGLFDYAGLTALLRQVDFQQTVLEGMLAFLLFTGALHVDVVSLRGRAVTIGLMATLPDLCITQCNCGTCQNIVVDNNLIMITIANAPCGFFCSAVLGLCVSRSADAGRPLHTDEA